MPRVAKAEVDRRREQLAELLLRERYLPVGEVARRLNVSEVTARRDLAALEGEQIVRRTHGGALTAADADRYDRTFASFGKRRTRHASAKRLIAAAAARRIEPGSTVFLDAGTTCFRVAEYLRRHPVGELTVVTQSLAVATRLAGDESLSVHLLGGKLLPRQRITLGAQTVAAARRWDVDLALLGAEAFGPAGIANSQDDVAQLQRAVMRRSAAHAFLLDASKLGGDAPVLVAPWGDIDTLITDTPADALAFWPVGPRHLHTTHES